MTTPAAAGTPTDVLVIGGGPVGLFQVFQLGLQDLRATVVDALPHLGGQCIELYPDKPIYDIPGVPVCSGRELVARLQQQIAPMAPHVLLGQTVARVEPREDGGFHIETSAGKALTAQAVVIAAGVGAFEPKRLKLDGIAPHEASGQVVYHLPDPSVLAGKAVLLLGGEEDAVDAALALTAPGQAEAPASLTLVHRREVLKAEPAALAELQSRIADGRLQFIAAQATGFQAADGRLQALQLTRPDASQLMLRADQVLVRMGISPRLGPIADWGLAMARKQLVVDTEGFQTSQPGIHAVGDVNTYPGKKKLILCGFHEATLAAYAIAARLHPERPQHLQYTTTSPRLHRLLGVGG